MTVAVAQPPAFPTKGFSVTPTALIGAQSHTITINGQFVSDQTIVDVRLGSGPNIVTNVNWSAPRTLIVTCNFTTEGLHTVTLNNGGIVFPFTQQISLSTTAWTDLTQALTFGADRTTDLLVANGTVPTFGANGMTITRPIFGDGTYRGMQFNSANLRSNTASESKTLQGIIQFDTANRIAFGWSRTSPDVNAFAAYLWGFLMFFQDRQQSTSTVGGNAQQTQPTSLSISPQFTGFVNGNWYRISTTLNGQPGSAVVTVHELASNNESDWLGGTLRQTYTVPNATGIVSPSGIVYPMITCEQPGAVIRAIRSF